MHRNLRRSGAALATAFACLALMANPASATPHTAVITTGTIVMIGVNAITQSIPLGGTTGSACSSALVIDQTGTSGDVTALTVTNRFTLTTSTNHYIAVITRTSSTAGTITTSGTTHNVASVFVTLRIDVFLALNNMSTETDCAITGNRLCRLTATLHLSGTASSNPIATSTTLGLSAASATIVTSPPCPVPFTTFGGGTSAVTGVGIHVTS